jgi:hypothetical protein
VSEAPTLTRLLAEAATALLNGVRRHETATEVWRVKAYAMGEAAYRIDIFRRGEQ